MAGRAMASSGSLQIAGYVLDNSGHPVVGLDVIGDDYVGDILVSRPTDSAGYCDVDADSDGNYRITPSCAELTARGFACVPSVAVSLSGEAVRVDFIVYPKSSPLQITNTSLPKGNVGCAYSAQLGAIGGQAPYNWQLAIGSTNLPEGLSISSGGLISGTPITNLTASINVQVTDSNSVSTNKVLSITINPRPVLSAPASATNQFSMLLMGASNQNYTVQVSTDLNSSNWTSLFVTNSPSASEFILLDPMATNKERFYRVLIGP